MARRPQARITFGTVKRVSLPPAKVRHHLKSKSNGPLPLEAALQQALTAGTIHERYGREWRMGKWDRKGDSIIGRIGYQAAGEVTELWDDELNDFRPQQLMTGTTAPFAIDVETLRLAFQIRPRNIQRGSFVGALQGLMNEASDFDRWQVTPDFYGVPWTRWTKEVERVARLEVKLERPNPDYHGREDVERLIEEVGAEVMRIAYEAPDDESLNIDDDVVQEIIDHAAEYGSWRATGEVVEEGETRVVQWRSEQEGVAPERRVEADPATREARPPDLVEGLREAEERENDDDDDDD